MTNKFAKMFSKSTWLHLRIPFSFFLMPVYLFALGVSPNFTEPKLIWTFVIVHLLLYPASNGYNSYFDKDEKSIGGLANPPPVEKGLYYTSLMFDLAAVILGYLRINLTFSIMLLVYGLISKAYSHPAIRLKKYPVTGWITVAFFQGIFAFLMCYAGINGYGFENLWNGPVLVPAALSTLLLLGTYPMTQVYQHEEDARHGDRTISLVLGIRGTFWLAVFIFGLSSIGFVAFFSARYDIKYAVAFLLALTPVVLFFVTWFWRVWRDASLANHRNLTWLNFLAGLCLNVFFIYFFLDSTQVLQAIKAGY